MAALCPEIPLLNPTMPPPIAELGIALLCLLLHATSSTDIRKTNDPVDQTNRLANELNNDIATGNTILNEPNRGSVWNRDPNDPTWNNPKKLVRGAYNDIVDPIYGDEDNSAETQSSTVLYLANSANAVAKCDGGCSDSTGTMTANGFDKQAWLIASGTASSSATATSTSSSSATSDSTSTASSRSNGGMGNVGNGGVGNLEGNGGVGNVGGTGSSAGSATSSSKASFTASASAADTGSASSSTSDSTASGDGGSGTASNDGTASVRFYFFNFNREHSTKSSNHLFLIVA